jgi:hypothetical protein
MSIVVEHFRTFVSQVERLLALSCCRFEATGHKFHCKRPSKEPLVKGKKGLLQRSYLLTYLLTP